MSANGELVHGRGVVSSNRTVGQNGETSGVYEVHFPVGLNTSLCASSATIGYVNDGTPQPAPGYVKVRPGLGNHAEIVLVETFVPRHPGLLQAADRPFHLTVLC